MPDRYIPPISKMDPPSAELTILLMEAINRKTEAFVDLRNRIFPTCAGGVNYLSLDLFNGWLDAHHIHFPNEKMQEMVEGWALQLLYRWFGNPNEAKLEGRPVIDLGFWDRTSKRASDRPLITFEGAGLEQWNIDRESWDSYSSRMRGVFEEFMSAQRQHEEAQLARFEMTPVVMRNGKTPVEWRFDWVALHWCKGWSDQRIANVKEYKDAGITRDRVKKARQSLEADLQFHVSGEISD